MFMGSSNPLPPLFHQKAEPHRLRSPLIYYGLMPSQQDLQLEYDRICSFFALYKNDYNYNSSFKVNFFILEWTSLVAGKRDYFIICRNTIVS